MPKKYDLAGLKFGRLLVVKRNGNDRHKNAIWECRCDCGNVINSTSVRLRRGETKSCGCLRREKTAAFNRETKTTHGKTHSTEYNSWSGMRSRCNNKNDTAYDRYGGRGIYVCERWDSFENFLDDMGKRPSKSHSIDRIDNNGPYSPENCRWADWDIQANNRRGLRIIEFNGKKMTLSKWAVLLGVNITTLHKRLSSGWSIEKTLTTPVRRA